MASTLESALVALQAFQVAFLVLHDWLPLPPLNDVAAVRREDPLARLIGVTLVQTVPWAIGLYFSAISLGHPWPGWLGTWLWVTYGLLFVGQLRAWWVPYLAKAEPERAARYQRMFGNTHSFLPHRNGMVPNTAHILLHVATAATLLLLLIRQVSR
jgi:hypothetical protein